MEQKRGLGLSLIGETEHCERKAALMCGAAFLVDGSSDSTSVS